MFVHNGLHIITKIHKDSQVGSSQHSSHDSLIVRQVGKQNSMGLVDVVVEAALTAIMDCEDSVAAVDADDKARVYSNWSGLMRGSVSCK